jgi:MFS family permease
VFIFSVIWGRIFDAYGARPLVWGGTTLSVVAVIAMAFCEQYYQFFLAHFLFGFASGMIWPTVTAVGGHWFSTRRGAAIGLIVGGSGGGGIVYPIMLKHLFQKTCK